MNGTASGRTARYTARSRPAFCCLAAQYLTGGSLRTKPWKLHEGQAPRATAAQSSFVCSVIAMLPLKISSFQMKTKPRTNRAARGRTVR